MFDKGAMAAGRSLLAAGVAAVSAAAVLAPPAQPHLDLDPTVRLTEPAAAVFDLAGLAGTAGPSSIGDGLIGFYLTVEPYTQYGANLASWAVGWVPFLGLLAPQINFFYTLDEAINRSLVFNTAYLLDGTVDLREALSNISSATSAAWHDFVNTQASWLHGLLPPPPPSLPTLDSVGEPPDPAAVPDLPDLSSLVP